MPPAFRADQVGSLLRPQELLQTRANSDLSATYTKNSDQALIKAETDAIHLVVKEQISRGVVPIVNGEYPRAIFYSGLFENLTGMTVFPALPIPEAFRTEFPTTTGLLKNFGLKTRASVIATGKIVFDETRPPYLDEWMQLRDSLPDQSYWSKAKITIPAPSYQHIQLKPGTAFTAGSGYHNDVDYFKDLAKCYIRIIERLYEAGCRFVQIDDPHLTYFCDQSFLAGCEKDGTDTDELLDLYLNVYSWIFEPLGKDSIYADLRVGIHLCRGNMVSSTHWVTGSYERIAKKLFQNTAGVDTFYLEFDDQTRAGGFDPLKHLPRGKSVVLGLVSTKVSELESRDVLLQKIYQAAEIVAAAWGVDKEEAIYEAIAISPQCGFSSHSMQGGKGMTWEKQWQKLELLRDVAQAVWK